MKFTKNLSQFIILTFLGISILSPNLSIADCTYNKPMVVEEFAMGNMLTWSTQSEINNKAFIIEKSEDGETYKGIGKVKGNGTTSSAKDYRFLDVSASKGVAYYRLKQINIDRTFNYTDAISIRKETGNNFTIVSMTPPNEKNTVFEVTINAVEKEEMDYTIYDLEGKPIYTEKKQLQKGINIISVDVSEIGEQIYGFAADDKQLGTDVPYKVSLKGKEEIETLTIGQANAQQTTKSSNK